MRLKNIPRLYVVVKVLDPDCYCDFKKRIIVSGDTTLYFDGEKFIIKQVVGHKQKVIYSSYAEMNACNVFYEMIEKKNRHGHSCS